MIEASRMKRKVIFFTILLGVLFGVIGIVKVISSRSPKEGELRVVSSPAVSMFLNNKHIGITPYREKIEAGEYTIRLVPESANASIVPWQGKVMVGSGLLTYVNATMSDSELSTAIDILWLERTVSNKPELSVITSPDGATVVVDDVTKGMTPLTLQDLTAGEHSLTVTSPGFLTRTMKIRLTDGHKLITSLKLALSAAGSSNKTEATPSAEMTTPTPTTTESGSDKEPSAAPKKPYITIDETPTGFLRVRMEPSTQATEAGRVDPGDQFHVLEEKDGWYQIEYDGTKSGWVSGQYATKTE